MGKKTVNKQLEEGVNDEAVESSANKTEFLKKKPWSQEQDNLVRRLVQKYGPQRWSFIAKFVPGRLGKQCRERWHNHLNPKILKTDWMNYEEWVLFLAHTAHGSKWAEMTKMIPGRTDNSIKNHWNSTMKKRNLDFIEILEDMVSKNKKVFLNRHADIPEHYIKMEQELIEVIFENKENIIKPQVNREQHHSCEKKSFSLFQSKDKNTTVAQSRNQNEYGTRTHEKHYDSSNIIVHPFSSIKKSERSHVIRENLGSLIFETPPKGQYRNCSAKMMDSQRLICDKILMISPTPMKIIPDEPQDYVNLESPGNFLARSQQKQRNLFNE